MPPKLRRGMGMCGNAAIIIWYQQCYASTRVSCSLVPGAAYLVPGPRYVCTYQHNRPLQNQRYWGLFRAETLLVSRDHLITGVTSKVTPSLCDGDKGEVQFPHGTRIHCEATPCVETAVHAEVAETPLP